jgi:hypothetical protein
MTYYRGRRICWPNPDATCLEGGCIHCADQAFVSGAKIMVYVEMHPTLPHRGNGKVVDSEDAQAYSLTNPRVQWWGGRPV